MAQVPRLPPETGHGVLAQKAVPPRYTAPLRWTSRASSHPVWHRAQFPPWAGLAGSEFTGHYTSPESHHCLLLHLHKLCACVHLPPALTATRQRRLAGSILQLNQDPGKGQRSGEWLGSRPDRLAGSILQLYQDPGQGWRSGKLLRRGWSGCKRSILQSYQE